MWAIPKEIWKFKITLSTDCMLRCSHCFIDKNLNLTLPRKQAFRAIDFFIKAPPKVKKLEILGGEPFLHPELVKSLVIKAKIESNKLKKKLTLDIATNAALLDENFIRFLKENSVKISISFSGTEYSHNFTRKFPDGTGSYGKVRGNIKRLMKIMDPLHLTALICVHPKTSSRLFEDFRSASELGFSIFNLESVSGQPWAESDFRDFLSNMEMIGDFLKREIERDSFLMFETFISSVAPDYAERNCPFYRDFEIYPDGNFAFYPYAFIKKKKDMQKITIGNADTGLNERFSECRPGGELCPGCLRNYYVLEGLEDGSKAYRMRTEALERLFGEILKKSATVPAYRRYLKKLIRIAKTLY